MTEVLQNMTGINQINTGICEGIQAIDFLNFVDVATQYRINIYETRMIDFAAT